jgi:hypothetical protein
MASRRKEIGEPELGPLLVCSLDFPFADGFTSDVKLTRTQMIVQGASRCDFRYQVGMVDFLLGVSSRRQ